MDEVRPGQVVRHEIFGIGEILAATPGAARVRFVRHGELVEKEIVLGALSPAHDDDRLPTIRPKKSSTPDDRRIWTDDELAILVVAYQHNEFAAGDDRREENARLATSLGRTPAAIDRQWRNIDDVVGGKEVLHVGDNVVAAVEAYERDPNAARERARLIARDRGWNVEDLL
jgi:hypothetical protein